MNEHQERQVDHGGCDEYRTLSRRGFVTGAAALAAAPTALAIQTEGEVRPRRDVLITIFLAGGMDGLSAVVPYGDPEYYVRRPGLGIPPPGQPDGAIDLDGFFGLSPDLAPLIAPYQAGDLAIVHACGSTDPTRSHFDAMWYMQTATPNGIEGYSTGWIARHLMTSVPSVAAHFRGVGLGPSLPDSLRGAPGALPIPNLNDFSLPGNPDTSPAREVVLSALYDGALEPLGSSARNSIETVSILEAIDFPGYVPDHGAVYPPGNLSKNLERVAALLKADTGLETVNLKLEGWDTHAAQATILPGLLGQVGGGLEAFHKDMGDRLDGVTVVVMSEFGRRIAENGSGGTDHGHGNVMFVMGGTVNGGQVIADWPGLVTSGNGDVPITIDYRDILAEILQKRLGNPNLSEILPEYTPVFRGVVS